MIAALAAAAINATTAPNPANLAPMQEFLNRDMSILLSAIKPL